jgi:ABC-type transport system involved in multi-copper enzyme maturation permease subunit
MFMLYCGALLSVTFSISIFSDYIENGTELIIASKPLTRFQIILGKFLALLSIILIFTLIDLLLVPIMKIVYYDSIDNSQL